MSQIDFFEAGSARTHRGEGPTGSTLSLVLDRRDGSLLAPVHLLGEGDVGGRDERGTDEALGALLPPEIVAVSVHRVHELLVKLDDGGEESLDEARARGFGRLRDLRDGTYQISEVVHFQEVALSSLHGLVVVLGDLGLVLHEDLHAELFLRRRVVRLAWFGKKSNAFSSSALGRRRTLATRTHRASS